MTVNTNHIAHGPADPSLSTWRGWVAFWGGEPAAADDVVAPGVLVHGTIGGPERGVGVLHAMATDLRALRPHGRLLVTVGPLVAGAHVAGRWVLLDAASGSTGAITGTDILRIDGGRVVECWVSHDTTVVEPRLGQPFRFAVAS
jgi:hypothetical protein